jgi:hypothetical protein
MDWTPVIVAGIGALAGVIIVAVVVVALRRRITRFAKQGADIQVEAAVEERREVELDRSKVTGGSTIDGLKGTLIKLVRSHVDEKSVVRVRDSGAPPESDD